MLYMSGNHFAVLGNRVIINGRELPPCPSEGKNVTTINGRVYIDGYEFKRGKWRRTLIAVALFNEDAVVINADW